MASEENKSHFSRPIRREGTGLGLSISDDITVSNIWDRSRLTQPGEFNESRIILARTATFLSIAGTDPTKRNIVLGNHSAHSDETSLT